VIGIDLESVASLWLCAKKFKTLNICTIVVLWSFVVVMEIEELFVLSGESVA
jgi:hypothetical protein